MDKDLVIKYWFDGSLEALEIAKNLHDSRKYNYCLFFGHLALEKLLKGLVVVRTGKAALPIHDLVRLVHYAGIQLNEEQVRELKEISSFNLKARYDDYKRKFYKKATLEYTDKWFGIIEEYVSWLKQQ